MFVEMGHGLAHRFDPLTVCAYEVDVEDIADLRREAGRRLNGVRLTDLSCPWADDVANKRQPASWRLAERLIAAGTAGVLVPSFASGAASTMSNLVLWKWGPTLPHRVEVYDPSGRLPKDQTSWPASSR
jgi:RES domain-containing protein